MNIAPATKHDIPHLVNLINSAYRGEVSRKGWTTEADLLAGELRTDREAMEHLMNTPGAVFLKYTESSSIVACVYLHKQDRGLYLGMLSVSPLLQGEGIGKKLLEAAAVHASTNNCKSIFMQVISLRYELIAWYERNGYRPTGERKPFPADNRFGIPTQPLEFIILEKLITAASYTGD